MKIINFLVDGFKIIPAFIFLSFLLFLPDDILSKLLEKWCKKVGVRLE